MENLKFSSNSQEEMSASSLELLWQINGWNLLNLQNKGNLIEAAYLSIPDMADRFKHWILKIHE